MPSWMPVAWNAMLSGRVGASGFADAPDAPTECSGHQALVAIAARRDDGRGVVATAGVDMNAKCGRLDAATPVI
jgi:hypothetical protein